MPISLSSLLVGHGDKKRQRCAISHQCQLTYLGCSTFLLCSCVLVLPGLPIVLALPLQYYTKCISNLGPIDKPCSQRASILKEVQFMRQVDRPNIVKLIFRAPPILLHLAGALPWSRPIPSIVRLTYFSEDLSCYIILQVTNANEYLHETFGVVHRLDTSLPLHQSSALTPYSRDIKPENPLCYPVHFAPSKKSQPTSAGQ